MNEQTLPLFYRKPRPLTVERDSDTSLAPAGYGFAASTNAIPLMAAEFAQACRDYPVLFSDGPAMQPVALVGLRPGANLFVSGEGEWESGRYVPAYARRYPFIFHENAEAGRFTLCVDTEADHVVDGRDNPFFADGKPTKVTEDALAFARDFQTHVTTTAEFVKAVIEADLLVDNRADITLVSGERISLAGFKVIDEGRFGKVDDETLLAWRARGWLAPIYAHLISTGSWAQLIDRAGSAARPAGQAAD